MRQLSYWIQLYSYLKVFTGARGISAMFLQVSDRKSSGVGWFSVNLMVIRTFFLFNHSYEFCHVNHIWWFNWLQLDRHWKRLFFFEIEDSEPSLNYGKLSFRELHRHVVWWIQQCNQSYAYRLIHISYHGNSESQSVITLIVQSGFWHLFFK